jgi:putative glutamine amidotransferase
MMSKPLIGIGSDVLISQGERDRAFVFTTYVEALRRAGAMPVLIPPQPENAVPLLDGLDGLVLAGGEDCDPAAYGQERHPTCAPMDHRRQSNDLTLAKTARERGIPTLGICLGMQMMNVAAGGTLIQDIESAIDTRIGHASEPSDRARHEVTVEPSTLTGRIIGERELTVNSSHHQAVGDIAPGLVPTAHAPDGVVEGIEDPKHPFYVGVQWHPEDMAGETCAEKLFAALVEAAKSRAGHRRSDTEVSLSSE